MPPKATCQSGTVGGQTKASKIPVTIAEQSFTRIFCFVASWKRASEATQLSTDVRITNNALNPYKNTPFTHNGSNAMITNNIV